jgi:DNA-binding NarL/FixJ family response regulator
MRLLEQHPGGVGYLLKERVSGVGVLADALARVHQGECVVDPTIVSRLLRRARPASPLGQLTEREREVLALMAEGRSNAAIAQRLFITEKAVSKHAAGIFGKLDLAPSDDDNRRVLAVLAYLGS